MNYKKFIQILEQNGWKEIDLNDDYEYELTARVKGMKDDREALKKLVQEVRAMTLEEQMEWIRKRDKEIQENKIDYEHREYERVHMYDDEKTVEFLTEGEISNDSNHICYALEPDVKPDVTDFSQCGFIKNVLFIKIENDEVVDWFIQFAVKSSVEHKRAIYHFLNTISKEK